jgi:hypothetical protein
MHTHTHTYIVFHPVDGPAVVEFKIAWCQSSVIFIQFIFHQFLESHIDI